MTLRRTALALAASLSTLALSAAAQAAIVGVSSTDFVTPASAAQNVQFSVYLPLRDQAGLTALLADLNNPASANYQKWLTPDQFNARFGPTDASVANVTKALAAQGLAVTGRSGATLQVSGTAGAVSKTFATTLSSVQPRVGLSRMVANSALTLPSALQAEGVKILAFSGRPPMHTHAQRSTGKFSPQNRYGPSGPYWFTDLKQAYSYPSYQSLDGTGVGVAIVISSSVLNSDIAAIFNHEKFTTLTGKPPPTVTNVPLTVNGRPPGAFDPGSDASFEASLDVQEVLGGAPGASVSTIDIPDLNDDAIMAAYNYVVQQGGKKFQLVNSSFGECELFYTSPAYGGGPGAAGDDTLNEYESIFMQGNAEGITFVASSGDSDGLGCPDPNYVAPYIGKTPTAPPRFVIGIETPAASPHVTAVGGTNVVTNFSSSSLDSSYASENGLGDPELPYDPYGFGFNVSGGYWGAGGGLSTYFLKSPDASAVNTGSTYRTTPDIGMQVGGCPGGISVTPCGPNRSAVLIALAYDPVNNPYYYGVIGTSVSSPELVGALALYVQATMKKTNTVRGVGDVNAFLYAKGAAQTAGTSVSYHRNIPGFDGKYSGSYPSANYNYITGNGTPIVRQLFDMTSLPAAGLPQTPSNP